MVLLVLKLLVLKPSSSPLCIPSSIADEGEGGEEVGEGSGDIFSFLSLSFSFTLSFLSFSLSFSLSLLSFSIREALLDGRRVRKAVSFSFSLSLSFSFVVFLLLSVRKVCFLFSFSRASSLSFSLSFSLSSSLRGDGGNRVTLPFSVSVRMFNFEMREEEGVVGRGSVSCVATIAMKFGFTAYFGS